MHVDCIKVLKMMCTKPKWMSVSLCLFVIAVLHPHRVVASDVTYDELIEMKVACGDLDSCQGNRTTDDLRVVNCQCGPVCAELGTCCVDSEYRALQADKRNNRIAVTQVQLNTVFVFMVRDCKPDWNGDQGIKDLCDEGNVEHDADFTEDLFLFIPVTNTRTGITYRNYYCFACNEEDSLDSPVLWDIHLFQNVLLLDALVSVGHVSDITHEGGTEFYVKDVRLWGTVGVPEKLFKYVNWYRQRVIGNCPESWTDVTVIDKCEAYTALVHIGIEGIYKNPHCAICNYKSVSGFLCSAPNEYRPWGGPPYRHLLSGIFSFEDEDKRCAKNEVFDAYSKKCRAFRCERNQKLEGLECVGSSPDA